jgi:F0F1-type ATP synthase assembly protein I
LQALWFAFCNLLTTKHKQMANQKGDTENFIKYLKRTSRESPTELLLDLIPGIILGFVLSKVLTYLGFW